MRSHSFRLALLAALLALVGAPVCSAAAAPRRVHAVVSDLVPTEERQPALALGAQLSHPSEPAPVSAGLKTPFDYDKAEPDPTPVSNGGDSTQPAPTKSARDILEILASLLKPAGTMILPGRPAIITFGRNTVKVGGTFTINFEGNDYPLELVAVTSTSFTVRYKTEETTRPITSKK